jgi:hypothetical protein
VIYLGRFFVAEPLPGIASIHEIGEDNITCETDCIGTVKERIGHLPPEVQDKLLRGNAEQLYRFTPAEPPVAR